MPNSQGGYTAEEEAEAVARALREAYQSQAAFAPEQNPTVEQQNQQVADNMAQALLSQNTENQEQRGILDVLGTTLGYGIGPPYAASAQPYNGPPPMEAQPDWNYDSGYPGNWHDFSSNNTSTGGGFFAFDELYNHVPDAFQSGSDLPSTNNYRLLPPEYRKPNYIMRNGHIIDMNSETVYGPWGRGEFGGRYSNPSWRGGSALGVPAAHAFGSIAGTVFGWPGQIDQIGYIPPAR